MVNGRSYNFMLLLHELVSAGLFAAAQSYVATV